jgi:hypothetical protein
MANLKLWILNTDDREQQLTGDVWTEAAGDHDPPMVSEVNTRLGSYSYFTLAPGDYVYRFAANRDGKFSIELDVIDGNKIVSKDYDTAIVGRRGRTLQFTVS